MMKRGAQVALTVAAALGLAGSMLGYTTLRRYEAAEVDEDLQHEAGGGVLALQRELELTLSQIRVVGDFYDASQWVERDEFTTFVTPILQRYPTIQALEWIARVEAADRAVFEEAVRQEGYPNFEITEARQTGELVRASPRAEYFPVLYLEPSEGRERMLGFDLASEATRRQALERALEDHTLALTGSIRSMHGDGEDAVLAFWPVYEKPVALETTAQRHDRLMGQVLGVFHIGALLETVLERYENGQRPVHYVLHDISTREAPALLGAYPSNRLLAAEGRGGMTLGEDTGEAMFEFEVGGRRWRMLARPILAHGAWVDRTLSSMFLGGGLVATVVFVFYLSGVLGRAGRIEVLVAQRTAEIQEINRRLESEKEQFEELSGQLQKMTEELKGEVAERQRAEAALLRSNERLETQVAERTKALEAAKSALEHQVQQRTEELRTKVKELEDFNAILTGREERVMELKREVNGLLQQLGRTAQYGV